jgi:HK97 family phage major capsid protein
VSRRAAAALASPETIPEFDRFLRSPRQLNPGTTADLIAAARRPVIVADRGVTFSGGATATYSTQQGGSTGNCGTFAQYVALETAIANANLDVANMRYVMNTATRGGLKTTLRDSVAGADYIFRDNGTVNGYQVTVSNQLQQNDVFMGNWSDLIVGFWSGIDLIVDPYTQSAKGQVLFTAFQDFDVAARRADSFALGT